MSPTSDKDIWRSANLLIQQHGEDARIHAAQMADGPPIKPTIYFRYSGFNGVKSYADGINRKDNLLSVVEFGPGAIMRLVIDCPIRNGLTL